MSHEKLIVKSHKPTKLRERCFIIFSVCLLFIAKNKLRIVFVTPWYVTIASLCANNCEVRVLFQIGFLQSRLSQQFPATVAFNWNWTQLNVITTYRGAGALSELLLVTASHWSDFNPDEMRILAASVFFLDLNNRGTPPPHDGPERPRDWSAALGGRGGGLAAPS